MNIADTSIKAVGIFCTTLEIGNEPISSEYYWEAYQDFLLALKDRGVEAYFVTDNRSYLGGGRFKTAYTTNLKVSSPKRLKKVNNVHVDLVFERSESDPFSGRDITVINPESIRRIANNKISIFNTFPSLQPQSAIVNSRAQLAKAIAAMDGDKVVVKEPDGFGGDAVYIGAKTEVSSQTPDRFPLLVQEFLDTSMGVPGQKRGVHDVRLEICGGQITGYYMRIAKSGAYHSNVHQGGNMTFLPIEKVPLELAKLVREIDQVFAPAPRFYAADFAYSNKGWKLIELNDYVGLARTQQTQSTRHSNSDNEAIKSLNRLADYLVSVCNAVEYRAEPIPF